MKALSALLPLILLLSACVHDGVEDFSFIEYSGLKRPLVEAPSVPAGEEGRLIAGETGLSTPFYRLEQEIQLDARDRSFFIVYTADCPLTLRMHLNGGIETAELPFFPGREVEYRMPLPEGARLSGFQLASAKHVTDGSLQILATGVEDLFPGARLNEETIVIGSGINLDRDAASGAVTLYLQQNGIENASIYDLRIHTETASPVRITALAEDQNELDLLFRSRSGSNRIELHTRLIGFRPERLVIDGEWVKLETFEQISLPAGREPIGIDPASLLRYRREDWRREDYELFRWNLVPEILIFDFADYGVQSRFLKRLSFFVEKAGFQGSLLTNAELEPRHGWNAHDYRAEDLASFFTLAEEQAFPLNPEEEELKEILLENGILLPRGAGYSAGTGAIISLTQESGEYLRSLFLTHEGLHGLFFADEGLRERSRALWESFSDLEQSFWKMFLATKQYDPNDEYLVINELQAYLLQQSVEQADPYYIGYTIPRMSRQFPEFAAVAENLVAQYPDHFTRSAAFLQAYLESSWGVYGGDLQNLQYLD